MSRQHRHNFLSCLPSLTAVSAQLTNLTSRLIISSQSWFCWSPGWAAALKSNFKRPNNNPGWQGRPLPLTFELPIISGKCYTRSPTTLPQLKKLQKKIRLKSNFVLNWSKTQAGNLEIEGETDGGRSKNLTVRQEMGTVGCNQNEILGLNIKY